MATALYRKYRPQKFADLTNQNHVKVTLGNEVATGKIAHAYLFTGPRGVGKTTTARILAQAINCVARKEGAPEPCGDCEACNDIREGKSLDVMEIDAASHTGVDNVRENIVENARFTPSRRKFKVFIIDEVHMLSTSAFNALLKTLEEPPAHAIFVLATTEAHKVPETIISRCQRFDFRRIILPELVERLAHLSAEEGIRVEKKVLERVARASGGSVRDAESLLGQVFALGGTEVTEEAASLVLPRHDIELAAGYLEAVSRGDAAAAFPVIKRLIDDGVDLPHFVSDAIDILRAALHRRLEVGQILRSEFDDQTEKAVGRLSEALSPAAMALMLEKLAEVRVALRAEDSATLPLEIAAVELSEISRGAMVHSMTPGLVEVSKSISDSPSLSLRGAPPKRGDEAISTPSRPKAQAGEGSSVVDVGAVRLRWQEIINAAGAVTPSLPFLLSTAVPVSISSDLLTVSVAYPFHQSKLHEDKNRQTLESVLLQILGTPLRLAAVVDQAAASSPPPDDPNIQKALEAFGGKIVG